MTQQNLNLNELTATGRRKGQLGFELLKLLADSPSGSMTVTTAISSLKKVMPMLPEERGRTETGVERFHCRVTTLMSLMTFVKPALTERPGKGIWKISDFGRVFLKDKTPDDLARKTMAEHSARCRESQKRTAAREVQRELRKAARKTPRRAARSSRRTAKLVKRNTDGSTVVLETDNLELLRELF